MSRSFRRIALPVILLGIDLGALLVVASRPDSAEWVDQALATVAWLLAAWSVTSILSVFLWEGIVPRTIGGPSPRLLRDFAGAVVYTLALTAIVGLVYDQPITGIWATSGMVGILLGLALRNIIVDVFIGLAVNIDHPYRIGDWVMVHSGSGVPGEGMVGCVVDLNWRTTRIRTTENTMVIVPNSVMGERVVTNFMLPDERSRFEIVFCIDFSVPPERALRVLTAGAREAIGEDGPLADPPPKCRISGISSLGVEYKLKYWILPRDVSPPKARHQVMLRVLAHLRHAGISLAYPKQDTFHREMPTRNLDLDSSHDRVLLLRGVPLFHDLREAEIEDLAGRMVLREHPEGTAIVRRGDEGSSMFVLIEGLARVSIPGPEEEMSTVGVIRPGEFFGEMSLLTGEPRSATVTTATDTIGYEITREALSFLLATRPEIAGELSRAVAAHQLADSRNRERLQREQEAAAHEAVADSILQRMRRFFDHILVA